MIFRFSVSHARSPPVQWIKIIKPCHCFIQADPTNTFFFLSLLLSLSLCFASIIIIMSESPPLVADEAVRVSDAGLGLIVPMYHQQWTRMLLCAKRTPRSALYWPSGKSGEHPRVMLLPTFFFQVRVRLSTSTPIHTGREMAERLAKRLTGMYHRTMLPSRLSACTTPAELLDDIAAKELASIETDPRRTGQIVAARMVKGESQTTHDCPMFRVECQASDPDLADANGVYVVRGRHHVATLLFLEWLYGNDFQDTSHVDRTFDASVWVDNCQVQLRLIYGRSGTAAGGAIPPNGQSIRAHLLAWLRRQNLPTQASIADMRVVPGNHWPQRSLAEHWSNGPAVVCAGAVIVASHLPVGMSSFDVTDTVATAGSACDSASVDSDSVAPTLSSLRAVIIGNSGVHSAGVFLGRLERNNCRLDRVLCDRPVLAPRPISPAVRVRPNVKRSLEEVDVLARTTPAKRACLIASTLPYRIFATALLHVTDATALRALVERASDYVLEAWVLRQDDNKALALTILRKTKLVNAMMAGIAGRFDKGTPIHTAATHFLAA